MLNCGLAFHHLGVAVKDPADISAYLFAVGYHSGPSVYDSLQQAHLVMWSHDAMPDVELIWPGDGPSPVDRLIKSGMGNIYHQCYTTKDAEASLAALRESGLDILPIVEPRPAILFENTPVSFYAIAGVGIIELIHGEP